MGAARYLQNWRKFLGTYDHWRFLFAEWNKLIYLKSYLSDLSEHKKNNAFIMLQNGLFMPTNRVLLTAVAPSTFIPDGLVITQKLPVISFLLCYAIPPIKILNGHNRQNLQLSKLESGC